MARAVRPKLRSTRAIAVIAIPAPNIVVASHSCSGAAATAIALRPAMKPMKSEYPTKKRTSTVVEAKCELFAYARNLVASSYAPSPMVLSCG